jgi:DNA-binding transcriptional ArsR family regulator
MIGPQLQELFTITDLETLKVIADPLRLQILKTLHPKTVKDIAIEIDKHPTKLYYHVNQLEKHGFIQVVATNIVSGIIEKQYQATARNYRVDDELLSDQKFREEGLESLVMAILDDTKGEIRKSIQAGLIELSDKSHKKGRFIGMNLDLYQEQATELGAQLESLSKQYEALSKTNEDEPGAQPYGFTLALYPIYKHESSE